MPEVAATPQITDVSSNCYDVAKFWETCSLTAYPDPGSKDGKPVTIGWGHTGPGVALGMVWSQAKADATLVRDMASAVAAVVSLVKVPLTQGQLDGLSSFAFNVGIEQFEESTMLKLLNAGKYDAAALEFPRWRYNDGQVMRGLIRRRASEQALFNGSTGKEAIRLGTLAA